jgi:hypothetical protein
MADALVPEYSRRNIVVQPQFQRGRAPFRGTLRSERWNLEAEQIRYDISYLRSGVQSLQTELANQLALVDEGVSAETSGGGYILFPGSAGNYVSTPDAPAFDITGDITIVARIAPYSWKPATEMIFASKFLSTGDQRSYRFSIATGGQLRFTWSTTGVDTPAVASTEAVQDATGVRDGQFKWVAITFDVNNGASGKDARFWVSDDDTTWTQLGTTVTQAGTTSIFAGTALFSISGHSAGATLPFRGKVSNVRVHSNIGANGIVPGSGIIFRYRGLEDLGTDPNINTFQATSGHTMTVNRSGSTATTVVLDIHNIGVLDDLWSKISQFEQRIQQLEIQKGLRA